ncbi:MAG: hypothetical protein U0167_06870 [bacterium]
MGNRRPLATARASSATATGTAAAALRVFVPGLLLLLVTRAPLVASARFVPDGDEAIVGLMAKRLLEHGDLGLFYWGQAYGLALLESAAGALAFAIGGVSGAALKLGALAVFTSGFVAFVAAARRLAGDRAAMLFGMLLAAAPSWLAFSAKAWGGFVTAFALAPLALLCMPGRETAARRRSRAALAGAVFALTCFAQAIGALALAPLLLADELRPRRRGEWLALLAGAAALGATLLAAAHPGEAYWAPSLFRGTGGAAGAGLASPGIGRALWVMATGCHFMITPLLAPLLARVSAALALVALPALVIAAALRLRARSFPLEAACAASVILVLAAGLAMRPERLMFRYLVPLVAPLALGAAVLLARLASGGRPRRAFVIVAASAWTLAGAGAAWPMRDAAFSGWTANEERAIPRLVEALESAGVRCVCTTHPTLQWTLMFESRERLLARWTSPRDRRPEILRTVDAAVDAGETVAVVALPWDARAVQSALLRAAAVDSAAPPTPRAVGKAFVVWLGVSRAQLDAIGFARADVRS